jgi:multiple sugar transport system permease protein/putative aldouronate transport system permease protein
MNYSRHVRATAGDRVEILAMQIFVVLFAFLCFMPFWMVVVNSFASERVLSQDGYRLWPSEFSLEAYKYMLSGLQIYRSYGVTIFVTVVGTTIALMSTAMYAYFISSPKIKHRQLLSFLTFFIMVFGPGLVGSYILIANWLHLKDSLWALILPYAFNPFFALIMITFFRGIPKEYSEAATIDGANDFSAFFRVILPIAKPAAASVGLLYALYYWNDWWLALLYIDNDKLYPLQMLLRQVMSQVNLGAYIQGSQTNYAQAVPGLGLQLVVVCLTIGPIILAYPRVQRYFVKGIAVGGIKG